MEPGDDGARKRYEAILKAFDKALKEGPWNESGLLETTGKKLSEIRDWFAEEVQMEKARAIEKETSHPSKRALASNEVEIFISLYNATGTSMKKWEALLANVSSYALSRPIYRQEENVKALLRAKGNIKNEAYISVIVDSAAIMPPPPQRIPRDRLGHELLLIKERAVLPSNIRRLYHVSGTYTYHDGKLVRMGDNP